MNALISTPARLARRMLSPLRRQHAPATILPSFAVPAQAIGLLADPAAFRRTLLARIAAATQRILIVALYLQDDEAGREVLEALHQARARRPSLQVAVYVDWHRAQRGLIGKQKSEGNAAMYRAMAARFAPGVEVWGVPVQSRELFGVLHLKGFVFDDTVLYSGASLNDMYLGCHGRYRLDRYHLLQHGPLADAMAQFVERHFRHSEAVCRLDGPPAPSARALQPSLRALRQSLQSARYEVPDETPTAQQVAVTPLLGFGRNGNALDDALLSVLRGARERVIVLTPYFNLPRPVRVVLGQLLRRGCEIHIMVGDKTASDFYIPPGQPFTTIGLLPYLYESNLRRYAQAHRRQLASGQLNIHLWRDGDNSYHLKGLLIDDDVAVLTGHNLNPRAWSLDLENALLLRDPARLLWPQHAAEWRGLQQHAVRLVDYRALESPRHYPPAVRKQLRRLRPVRLDRLLNRLL